MPARTIYSVAVSDPGAVPVAVVTMRWWIVPWISGTVAGTRHVRAPDAASAEHDLETNPADFGLPHESVIVGRASPLRITDRLDV